MKDARQFLKVALDERMAVNTQYSLRAFARDLSLSPQQLSNVLNGRRGISDQMAETLANKLGLTDRDRELFCQSVRADFSRSKSQRTVARAKLAYLEKNSSTTKNLELDLFKIVSNWYHFALLDLIKISKSKNKTSDTRWFAQKLDIPENEVRMALSRLEKLELITKIASGWKVNQDTVTSDKGIPTEAVRNFHKQVLEKATQALAFQNKDERYGSSTTLPVRVKNLPRAKKLIQEFREKFNQELADQEDAEEVYGLSVQFFRLTKPENKL